MSELESTNLEKTISHCKQCGKKLQNSIDEHKDMCPMNVDVIKLFFDYVINKIKAVNPDIINECSGFHGGIIRDWILNDCQLEDFESKFKDIDLVRNKVTNMKKLSKHIHKKNMIIVDISSHDFIYGHTTYGTCNINCLIIPFSTGKIASTIPSLDVKIIMSDIHRKRFTIIQHKNRKKKSPQYYLLSKVHKMIKKGFTLYLNAQMEKIYRLCLKTHLEILLTLGENLNPKLDLLKNLKKPKTCMLDSEESSELLAERPESSESSESSDVSDSGYTRNYKS